MRRVRLEGLVSAARATIAHFDRRTHKEVDGEIGVWVYGKAARSQPCAGGQATSAFFRFAEARNHVEVFERGDVALDPAIRSQTAARIASLYSG